MCLLQSALKHVFISYEDESLLFLLLLIEWILSFHSYILHLGLKSTLFHKTDK